MISLHQRRVLDVAVGHPSERPFVAAASGLWVGFGQRYVVSDDEACLAVFPEGPGPGRRLPLWPGAPLHALEKAEKPDLEGLAALPGGRLLGLPSGSTPRRRRGALVSLGAKGEVLRSEMLELGPLFDRLAQETSELNLEGAALTPQGLWLAQRGNRSTPSALFLVNPRRLEQGQAPAADDFVRAVPLALGEVNGVPLTPTDLFPLKDGALLLTAAGEDTADAYNDGACVAAAVAVVEPTGRVRRLEQLTPVHKVEGVHAVERDGALELLLVADPDDPSIPAPLLEATWR